MRNSEKGRIHKTCLDIWVDKWQHGRLKRLIRIVHSMNVGRDGAVPHRGIVRLCLLGRVRCRGSGKIMW